MFGDQFVIQARLHAALFGDIWLCRDLQDDNRLVAVKQFHLDFARHALARNLLLDNPWNESRILDTLRVLGLHDNILQTRQQFHQDNSWCLVMEYCEGGDLWQALKSAPHNRLPEVQALPLFAQIVHGVQILHANGIAHRDLSLDNVLLSLNGNGEENNEADGSIAHLGAVTAKICDFGLITKADRICCESVGKPYYMAPEVVAGAAYDPRAADVWSLGIILFTLLTGSPLTPIASEDDQALAALKAFGIERIIESWHMGELVSLATVDMLAGLLQIDPLARFKVEDVVMHPALQL